MLGESSGYSTGLYLTKQSGTSRRTIRDPSKKIITHLKPYINRTRFICQSAAVAIKSSAKLLFLIYIAHTDKRRTAGLLHPHNRAPSFLWRGSATPPHPRSSALVQLTHCWSCTFTMPKVRISIYSLITERYIYSTARSQGLHLDFSVSVALPSSSSLQRFSSYCSGVDRRAWALVDYRGAAVFRQTSFLHTLKPVYKYCTFILNFIIVSTKKKKKRIYIYDTKG